MVSTSIKKLWIKAKGLQLTKTVSHSPNEGLVEKYNLIGSKDCFY